MLIQITKTNLIIQHEWTTCFPPQYGVFLLPLSQRKKFCCSENLLRTWRRYFHSRNIKGQKITEIWTFLDFPHIFSNDYIMVKLVMAVINIFSGMQSGLRRRALDVCRLFLSFWLSPTTFWKLHFVQKVEVAGRSFFTEKEERCHINYVICFFSTKHSFVKGNYEAIKRQFSPLQFTFVTSQTRHRECSLLNNHKKEKTAPKT